MEADERIPILNGHAWTLGLDVPADAILPRTTVAAGGPAPGLFSSVDPGLAARLRQGDFLVGGDRFGRGAIDDGPIRAILAAGIAAVIAHSFDPDFESWALDAGLPPLQLNEALVIHTGARLRVDLEGARVVNMSPGDRFPIRTLGEERLARLRRRHARG